MTELCFSESMAGSLKFAASMKKGRLLQGAAAVIGGTRGERAAALREARRPKPWPGETLDISPDDVRSLTLALDFGALSDLPERSETLRALFGDFPSVAETLTRENAATVCRLEEAKRAGEPVRAWFFPHDPGDLCGLYFLCDFFAGVDAPVSVVTLPVGEARSDAFVEYRGGGEIPPERLGAAARETKRLAPSERVAYALKWRMLREENAPLRAFLNGRVTSVPEDFYDSAIRRSIPQGEFVLAVVIGRTLSALPGVSDRTVFLRLKAMEARGELDCIAPPEDDNPYCGIYRKKQQQESSGRSPERL